MLRGTARRAGRYGDRQVKLGLELSGGVLIMVGYTEEELRAVNFLDLTHEDYRCQADWALTPALLRCVPQVINSEEIRKKS